MLCFSTKIAQNQKCFVCVFCYAFWLSTLILCRNSSTGSLSFQISIPSPLHRPPGLKIIKTTISHPSRTLFTISFINHTPHHRFPIRHHISDGSMSLLR
ncbi:uncharacterized protein K444DRAFT_184953 [Hyaloscypha bicolor E]|uniref:Uncharacterized protein n=1 Tax=Hyaloscypha bicolor E TaxID=1095630 RepID=A0A2J6TRN3_9HELO|nr:uncharacterized protein K444DRAFT_184953 [Hyaloscypha bicolor E]PMD65685.1 hypothetical protein K444DRAFT_184953 [Hyaloscypha bicolor E]